MVEGYLNEWHSDDGGGGEVVEFSGVATRDGEMGETNGAGVSDVVPVPVTMLAMGTDWPPPELQVEFYSLLPTARLIGDDLLSIVTKCFVAANKIKRAGTIELENLPSSILNIGLFMLH